MLPSAKAVPQATAPVEEASLDEACFLAALRRSVEGTTTPAEERLASATPDWTDRFGRICDRLAG
jgi:hypothetical protein